MNDVVHLGGRLAVSELAPTMIVRHDPMNDDMAVNVAQVATGTEPLNSQAGKEAVRLARVMAASDDLLEALVQAKKALWLDARAQWTMADFKAWPVVQQIDAALTKATGVAR